MGLAARLDCAQHPLLRGVAQTRPFVKSGGFDPRAENGAFWQAWFADPILRLPAGRWRLMAVTELGIGDCASSHRLEAAVEIEVLG